MMLPLLLGFQATDAPVARFNRSVRAHRALSRGSATVAVRTTGRLAGGSATYRMVWQQPNRVSVTVEKPAVAMQAASKRQFVWIGGNIVGIDHFAKEWLSMPVGERNPTLYRGIMYGSGALDDSARFLLDPTYYAKFMDLMALTRGWTTRQVGGTTVAVRQEGKDRNELIFSNGTGLLVGMKSSAGLDTAITYGAPTAINVPSRQGLTQVPVFRERWSPSKYATPQARQIAEASIRAYWNVRKLNYTMAGGGVSYKVEYDRGNFRHVRGEVTSVYRNKQLTVQWNSGASRTASGTRPELLDAAKKWNVDFEPMLLRMWSGKNPMQTYFRPGATVRLIASIRSGAVPVDILEVREGLSRMTIEIRRDNRLLSRVVSEQVDQRGNAVMTSESRFVYR
jgi:hypothetical protein